MAVLSDNDLWNILEKNPETRPNEKWIASAKTLLSSGSVFPLRIEGKIHFFCRVLQVATDYYKDYAGYSGDGFFRVELVERIFDNARAASGLPPWHEWDGNRSIIEFAEKRSFISTEVVRGHWEADGQYCKLTFSGRIRAAKQPEQPAPPVQDSAWRPGPAAPAPWELDPEGWGVSAKAAAQSNAQAAASGGAATVTVEKDAVKAESRIESGAVKVEANPTMNIILPDPAATRAQDIEIERIRQENETERTRIIAAAFTGKMEVTPTTDTGDPDGYTVVEFTDYVSILLGGPISNGTAENILKKAKVTVIGTRISSKGRPAVYSRAEAETAAREYVENKKQS